MEITTPEKCRIKYSDLPPAVDGSKPGDIHRQWGERKSVAAQWHWDGASWIPEPITHARIAAIDVSIFRTE